MKNWKILIPMICALAAIIGGIFNPRVLVQAWHFSVLVCLIPALGCLFLLLMFQATGGKWIDGIRPALMVGRGLIFWCFLSLIPMLIFQPTVYHWIPEEIGDRAIFLNRGFFTIRFIIYCLFFSGLSLAVGRGKSLGAGGLIAFALVAYFLAIDAVMAINPAWYSSGFPVVFMSACALSGLALALCFQVPAADKMVWRDAGNLLLASVIFWTYVSYLQFLIIWAGNLPEETGWYVVRGAGGWKWVTIFLALCNFFGPFFILLSRAVKEKPDRLRAVAAMILGSQVVYIYWLVMPSFPGRGLGGAHWLDPLVLIAAGGLFLWVFNRSFKKRKERDA